MRQRAVWLSCNALCTVCSEIICKLLPGKWYSLRVSSSWHQIRLCVSQINWAPAYRLVLTQFVMPASFALFKAAIRNWLHWRSPGVSHTDTVLDLRTRWYSRCHWPRWWSRALHFYTLKDAQHVSPLGVIQWCILLHYHFKMQNYLSGLYWEPVLPALPHPQ